MTGPVAVLIGPAASGKTSVAQALAERLGVPARDTDATIAERAGLSVPQIFATDGEAVFRELEAAAVLQELALHEGVLALGGGAVTTDRVRQALQAYSSAGGAVVYLEISAATAAQRLVGDASRPLLVGDPLGKWCALLESRAATYRQLAQLVVCAEAPVAQVAQEVADWLRAREAPQAGAASDRVPVAAAEQTYEVVIGRDLVAELPALLGPQVSQVLVVCPAPLDRYGQPVAALLVTAGYRVARVTVPDAEAQKTVAVAARCWSALGQAAFTRSDAVVAVGGGATTDLGGWVAATWLRGVRVVHYATTLLAMVDAAVGGKTGINTAEGKNLVGSFHPPTGVLCDLAALETLPNPDFRAGLAEVVKTGFIADPVILDLVEAHAAQLRCWPRHQDKQTWAVVRELVTRSVAVKARVVAADFTEQGEREFLNYGHTLAHAIEQVSGYSWRHGEAVAVGLVFAAELANLAGILPADRVTRHREILTTLGLPTSYHPGPGLSATSDQELWADLLTAMRRDKKSRGNRLRFVVLSEIGRPRRLVDPAPELLAQAFSAVRANWLPGSEPLAALDQHLAQ